MEWTHLFRDARLFRPSPREGAMEWTHLFRDARLFRPSPREGGEKVPEGRMRGFAPEDREQRTEDRVRGVGPSVLRHLSAVLRLPLIRRFAPPSPRLRGEKV